MSSVHLKCPKQGRPLLDKSLPAKAVWVSAVLTDVCDILGVNSRQGSGLPHSVSDPSSTANHFNTCSHCTLCPNACTQHLA